MKIFILEDDDYKFAVLGRFVQSISPNITLNVAKSYQSACKLLSTDREWDLLIIDMSIPTYDKSSIEPGGRFQPTGGKQVVRRLPRYGVSAPVIILTQFTSYSDEGRSISTDQIDREIAQLCPGNYLGLVHFDTKFASWEKCLRSHIEALLND